MTMTSNHQTRLDRLEFFESNSAPRGDEEDEEGNEDDLTVTMVGIGTIWFVLLLFCRQWSNRNRHAAIRFKKKC